MTKEFESQFLPLTKFDFSAIADIISQIPSLVFYNCGVDSGASQSHKHVQFVQMDISHLVIKLCVNNVKVIVMENV